MIFYLLLGSNLGRRKQTLQMARRLIEDRIGVIVAASAIHETEPWGYESSNRFLNQAIAVETDLDPIEVLDMTQEIERMLGRTQKTDDRYHDRTIDIDILLAGDLTISNERLTIPHPQLHKREFALIPLSEIIDKEYLIKTQNVINGETANH